MNILSNTVKRNIILVAIAVIALILLVVLIITDSGQTQNYYEDEYAVKATEKSDGSIKISVDAGKTKDVPWVYEPVEEKNPVISIEAKNNSSGALVLDVKSERTGYQTISIKKERVIKDISYPLARIYIDVVVSDVDGMLVATVSSVDESASDGKVGAADTDIPYYISGNYIYLPAGGDWEVTNPDLENDESISLGIDDKGSTYYRIDYLDEGKEKNLILASESLGQQINLKAVTGENEKIIIEKAAGK